MAEPEWAIIASSKKLTIGVGNFIRELSKKMSGNDLNQKIEEGISGIASIADKLHGVVIIHDMRDWSVVWMSPRGLKEFGITGFLYIKGQNYR